jgi:hypothetical protein
MTASRRATSINHTGNVMKFATFGLVGCLVLSGLLGCGEPKVVIPSSELTEEQKAAIRAEDAKVAAEESHGTKKK